MRWIDIWHALALEYPHMHPVVAFWAIEDILVHLNITLAGNVSYGTDISECGGVLNLQVLHQREIHILGSHQVHGCHVTVRTSSLLLEWYLELEPKLWCWNAGANSSFAFRGEF